ncbi:hypothetical protein HPP92_003930 [Vanilla planifolia]|uniref:Pectinesterase inhibitor domain-containing protein n=1 Tax=Vanilla planifolia TaxID=51239 RepID=A0A835VNZ7_VANPL|nr:hypothetical protein HPP92_004345 [Vanilla planifolia]KAG0503858.1 hypothetical protein HPP92_003930 [Vanilla planifolia]
MGRPSQPIEIAHQSLSFYSTDCIPISLRLVQLQKKSLARRHRPENPSVLGPIGGAVWSLICLLEEFHRSAVFVAEARTHLSSALTNRDTCLQGLVGSHGPHAADLVAAWYAAYKYVSNALSLVSYAGGNVHRRRLLVARGFPRCLGWQVRRLFGERRLHFLDGCHSGGGREWELHDGARYGGICAKQQRGAHGIMVRAGVYDENVVSLGIRRS